MKKRAMLVAAGAAFACVCVLAASGGGAGDGGAAAEKEREYMARNGGPVKIGGKGRIAVVDCRKAADTNDCLFGVEAVRNLFKPEIVFRAGGAFSVSGAGDAVSRSGDNAAVFVVDDPTLPMTLTAAEEKWAMVNAAKARADKPDAARFRRRMGLLFLRQCCRLMGSDATKTPECCLYPAFSLQDLDAIEGPDVAISVFIAISESMSRLGLEGEEIVSYRDACELGKAPAPTNEAQRAIWEKSKQ